MLRNARILCSNLIDNNEIREWSRPKNMSEWITYAVSDTISDLCFGCNLNLLQKSENRGFLQAFVAGIRALHIVSRFPQLRLMAEISLIKTWFRPDTCHGC